MTKDKKTLSEHAEDALYREIGEEVETQKILDWARRNWRIIMGAAIGVLIAVVGIQIWRAADARAKLNAAAEYETAESLMRSGNATGAYDALQKLAATRRGGMADLAALRAAEMDLAAGNREIAIGNLKKLKDDGATRDFRDLAAIKLAALIGNDMSTRDFEKFMSDATDTDSPFYYSATLLVAEKYLATGDAKSAGKYLDKILNDKNAPDSISTAAQALN